MENIPRVVIKSPITIMQVEITTEDANDATVVPNDVQGSELDDVDLGGDNGEPCSDMNSHDEPIVIEE